MASSLFKGVLIFVMVFTGALDTIGTTFPIQISNSKIVNTFMKVPCTNYFFIPISKYYSE